MIHQPWVIVPLRKLEPITNKDSKDWHVVDFKNQSKLNNTSTAERTNGASYSSRSSQLSMAPIEVTRKVWKVHCQLCWTVSLCVYCKPQYLSRTSRSVRVQKVILWTPSLQAPREGTWNKTRFECIFWKIVWCYFRQLFVNTLLLTDEIYQCTACVSKWVYEDPALIILGSRVQMN